MRFKVNIFFKVHENFFDFSFFDFFQAPGCIFLNLIFCIFCISLLCFNCGRFCVLFLLFSDSLNILRFRENISALQGNIAHIVLTVHSEKCRNRKISVKFGLHSPDPLSFQVADAVRRML